MMGKEEFVNICIAEGLTKEQAEVGWDEKPDDFELPSDPHRRRFIIRLLRKMMPDFIQALKNDSRRN